MEPSKATVNSDESGSVSERDGNTSYWVDVLRLIGGAVASQLIILVSTPVLSRIYQPDAFGESALFLSLMLIFGTVACFRYELAIVLPEKKSSAANLLAGSFTITTCLALLMIPVVGWWGPLLLESFQRDDLLNYLWLVPLALWVNGLFNVLSYWQTRNRNYNTLAASKVLSSVVYAMTAIVVGMLGYATGLSMIASFVLGQVVGVILMLGITLNRDLWFFFSQVSWSSMISEFRKYRKFPLIESWSALMNVVSANLPVLLLSFYFSPAVVGFFALSQRVLNIPMALIGRSVSQVFYQKASVAVHEGLLPSVVVGTLERLITYTTFPFVLLMIIAPELFSLAFGNQWSMAGIYVQILAPWLLMNFLYSPISHLTAVLQLQEVGLFLNGLLLLTRIGSLVYGGWCDSVFLALILYSLTGAVIYPVFFTFLLSKSKTSFRQLWGKIGRSQWVALLCLLPLILGKWGGLLSGNYLLGWSVLATLGYYLWVVINDDIFMKLAKARLGRFGGVFRT
jgi:lipopolysaccharide exporter